jgi:DNA-binding response OmpR family regulator
MLESQLLEYLMIHAGQIVTYNAIIDHVWGPEGGTPSMVRQLIYRLRLKLDADASRPPHVHTVPGVGYELVVTPAAAHPNGG